MAAANPPRDGEVAARRADGGGYPSLRRPETYNARRLRSEMSLPEVALWEQLRGKKLGVKFRRQHPMGPYVADFYCATLRLVIEVDGLAHDCGDRPAQDAKRDAWMAEQNYRVLRISASDVLNRLDDVVILISREAGSPLHHAGGMVPLPMNGEDSK